MASFLKDVGWKASLEKLILLEKLKEVVSCQDDVGKALLEELVKALLLQAFLPEGLSPATWAKLKLFKVEAVLNLCLKGLLLQALLLEVLSQVFITKLKLIKVQAASCKGDVEALV